ncbi:hypothetical protein IU405_03565 [Polaribacter sp. BAL334]|uniref:hypothetical protein n=1 Tax=Polaribacter sp. BAL334 TaxID=1708178 RepID=UPI0018D20A88|nr:hypothetical protein [Polaribacter sp. BAL334]MBG7611319.1 hypothetical protein [Polaribacter sp. BAL334]
MKKIVLTLTFCLSFLFSFGKNDNNQSLNIDVFNCWVQVRHVVTDPTTFESFSYTFTHWVGYAGSQESCDAQARNYLTTMGYISY